MPKAKPTNPNLAPPGTFTALVPTDEGRRRSTTAQQIDEHVGFRLRLRRETLGVSQEEISRKLGLSFQQLQKYEHGTNRVSASTLYLIAQILMVTPDYFFEGLPALAAERPETKLSLRAEALEGHSPAKARQILRAFAGLHHPETVASILRLASTLADIETTRRNIPEILQ